MHFIIHLNRAHFKKIRFMTRRMRELLRDMVLWYVAQIKYLCDSSQLFTDESLDQSLRIQEYRQTVDRF